MAARRGAESRLTGPGEADDSQAYPGERLGLPRDGTGSVSSLGRRLAALMIDWLLCMAISLAAFHTQAWTLPVFAAETYLLTALTGLTIGKRLLGLRVLRLDGRPPGLLWALVRTLLLLTVVPAVVTDRDLRGLHDRAANTVEVRL